VRLLIDTHTFLWFALDSPELSSTARDLIIDAENEILLSVASAWEIAIKVSIGKLTLSQPFTLFLPDQLRRNDIELLPVTLPHIQHIATLPFHHKDPFDRMIIAQSLVEKIPLISIDAVFDAYSVQRLW
jgi:PIN domain nuclease of toxin-antitoxin system